jgi:carbonic anhydrase/acetyltransferase-like protein (isoleucine patch superfamily)
MNVPAPSAGARPDARSNRRATFLFNVQSTLYLLLIFTLPSAAVFGLVTTAIYGALRLVAAAFAPLVYALAFVVVAGLLSIPHQKGIVAGKSPRSIAHPVYRNWRLYGLCWTALYYFKPIYYLCVTVPALKTLTFRLFGYRGSMDFTVYADTWIRDLPLLHFGPGVYLGNRATVGSNQCFGRDHILVDHITLEDGAVLGHLGMISPGVHIGKAAEIGVGAAVGLRATIGAGAAVGPCSGIGHGVRVGDDAEIGAMSYREQVVDRRSVRDSRGYGRRARPESNRVVDIAPDAGAVADSSRLRSMNPSRSAFGRAALSDKPDKLLIERGWF